MPSEPSPVSAMDIQIHGFVSQGGFVSTANDYIGKSSRGTLELFEAGLNVSASPIDRLRVGVQLFAHDEGAIGNYTPRIDWAFIDYRLRPWLGIRAGHTKIPFGLYNEYLDIDSGRLQILPPQSVYPLTNRDVLVAQTGFLVYGTLPLAAAGELEYSAYGGTLALGVPDHQPPGGPQVYAVDSKYVLGGQALWRPPVEGLRVGASLLRASFDQYLQFDAATTAILIAAGLAPADFDGKVIFALRPANLWVASLEYSEGDWLFAAEYSRWFARTPVEPAVLKLPNTLSERFYGMVTYRVSDRLETGAYYSVHNADIHHRDGRDPKFMPRHQAFQRDAAATLRLNVNEHWSWKLEGHFIDGAAGLDAASNPDPERYWWLFLAKSTVAF
ncbi:MAG: hypothetical protein AB7O24_09415 [Kofleriaceae bacterium]